ncbi:unnamed protein product [Miscanthus lutarioriparius]|uniref:Legume lectin domain-containing protein n=1 Tax=Miscanthus lutarioriparius TaxID=422564 RepID=A0A811QZ28_9POAL|nr:unnamed protein product [Miscanthus lutarioriparius]
MARANNRQGLNSCLPTRAGARAAAAQEGNSREQKELAFQEEQGAGVQQEARIYQGAIQVSPDTGNVGSYQDIMVNKSGSVLLQRRFTMWRRVDNGSGSATAPRVQVVSFNSTFSINVFHLPDSSSRPGEGLTFVVAQSRDEPPPDSYGGYLGLTNATLEANPTPARNCFMAVEFDTTKQDYDPSDNHVGSVVSVKVAGARPRTPRGLNTSNLEAIIDIVQWLSNLTNTFLHHY